MRHLAAAMLLLALAACTEAGPSPKTPARVQVVDKLIRAIEVGDCQKVKDLVVTPSEIDCGQITESIGLLADEGIDVDEISYDAGPVNGPSSTVEITWNKTMPRESMDVQRVDGEWLVVFDSAA
ncbi:MAG: hypothetical protein ABIN55_00810 [Aeromicrobium sp.]